MKYIVILMSLIMSAPMAANATGIIIKTKGQVSMQSLGLGSHRSLVKPVIEDLNINVVQFMQETDVEEVLEKLRKHPDIVYAQLDHEVKLRREPNDSDFHRQWALVKDKRTFGIDAISAWGLFGIGGKAGTSELVVAVVDGGMDIDHIDLVDNLWTNPLEIPNNDKDDDGNGYIDDIHGWSGLTNSPKIDPDYHGTHVAGIVGARGNNNESITGVNWDLKLMAVPGASGQTSKVLAAYGYILKQKQIWLQTDGAMGANVVATNSSFGVDFADCTSNKYAAWNDIYEEMGKVGILSAVATMNNSANVDVRGDVPSGCSSPYVVAVTNTNKRGKRAYAAYGKKSIDLAAPGSSILSTVPGNGTGTLSGTSMATPHVAGAIAYLHSAASKPFQDLAIEDPAAAALELKDVILRTVTPTHELKKETVSGGILNLNDAGDMISLFGMGQ